MLLLLLLLLLLFNLLFYHRHVNSFLIYFINIFLLHVCMAEDPPPMGSCAKKYSACMYVHVHLTDFFKTNLTKFAVVWVKKRPKRRVFWAREAPKEKGEKERARKKGGEEKKQFYTLSFYNGYFGDIFCRKKAVSPEDPSGDNVFKNPARHTPLAHLP